MFAVINFAGHQYKVAKGDVLTVNRLEDKEGSTVAVKEVLLTFAEGDKDITVGQPFVAGAQVDLKVVKHQKGEKVRVYKKIPKKRREINKGFRPAETVVEVVAVKAGGAKKAAPKKETAKKTAAAKKTDVAEKAEVKKEA